jgi:hypothetical protein
MENLEYRTMRFRVWGAHMSGILDGSAGGNRGVGHGMSNTNSGVGHPMSKGGSWSPSVKSGTETMGEGRKGGIDGLLMRQAASGPRKEGKRVRASVPSRQQKTPQE